MECCSLIKFYGTVCVHTCLYFVLTLQVHCIIIRFCRLSQTYMYIAHTPYLLIRLMSEGDSYRRGEVRCSTVVALKSGRDDRRGQPHDAAIITVVQCVRGQLQLTTLCYVATFLPGMYVSLYVYVLQLLSSYNIMHCSIWLHTVTCRSIYIYCALK